MSPTLPRILIDGSSYLYRAYHALPALTNSKQVPTGAVKGVISMIKRLQKDYLGSDLVVVFDAPGKTFRDDLYPEYKAHRPPMPDDLRQQIAPIHSIIKAMGLPLLSVGGVEADDVIGTLARQASDTAQPVVVSTGDKDMAQLVNEHITLVNTMSGSEMDSIGVMDKFGVAPKHIIDYLALLGDKSDNIPGVMGVGEKTAIALIQALGGLDDIYARLSEVGALGFRGASKTAEKLIAHRDLAYLSRRLATIKTDVDLPLDPLGLVNRKPDNAQLSILFEEFEFSAWRGELSEGEISQISATIDPHRDPPVDAVQSSPKAPMVKSPSARHYQTILRANELQDWLRKAWDAELIAVDTETTGLDVNVAKLVGVAMAVDVGEAIYIPVNHNYLGAPEQLSIDHVLGELKPLLEDLQVKKVGQNLKYDISILAGYGIDLRGVQHDTMLQAYLLDPAAMRHDMDTLAMRYLDLSTTKFEDIAGKGKGQLTFNQIPLEKATPYAAEDADITLQLHRALYPQLEAIQPLVNLFQTVEVPLISVLSRIERQGVLVDGRLLHEHSLELRQRLAELETDAWTLAGEPFNLASPKQLGAILFDKLGLPALKKTAKGAPSTKEEVLQELAVDYALPRLLLEHRGLSKLKSTYTDKLPTMINSETGRVHTSYHQAGTATGRLSSANPNLQNIPIKTAEGRRVREAFIAPPQSKIVAADYSQIELRIMAHLSEDATLMTAFAMGQDIHRSTAAEVFDTAPEEVTEGQRRSAKAINFGLIYGMSAFGLAKQLNISRSEAQHYIDLYFERYPGVKRYMTTVREHAAAQGFVETVFGRRLYLPDINARNAIRRQAAERTAINAPMQGTAADIIKIAMISVDHWLNDHALKSRVIMQVHDELVLEVPESEVDCIAEGLKSRMESAAQLRVPLLVEVGVGDNWNQAH